MRGWAHEHDQEHAGDSRHRTRGDEPRRGAEATLAQHEGHGRVQEARAFGLGHDGGAGQHVGVRAVVGHGDHAREDRGHRDVEHGTDDEGGDDADGQVTLGVLGFLGGGAHRVEADVAEEHHRGRPHRPGPAVGEEGLPVRGLHVLDAHHDEEQDHDALDGHHEGVEARALPHPDHEQDHDQQDDDHRREVDEGAVEGAGGGGHPDRQVDAEPVEDALEVTAPADGHGHGAHRVLEDQVPADHPGDDLAQGRVGVGVGAARDGDHGRELRVAEGGEGAGQPRQDVGHADGGAGLVGGGGARQHEDARPDDGADAEQGEVEGAEAAAQALLAPFRVSLQRLDGFRLEQV